MDPEHNLKGPFVDIIKAQSTGSVHPTQNQEIEANLVLRREDEESDHEYGEVEMVLRREDEEQDSYYSEADMVFGREDEDSEEYEESTVADMVYNRQESAQDEESKDGEMIFQRKESRPEEELDSQDIVFHRRYNGEVYDELSFETPVVFCRKDTEPHMRQPEILLQPEEEEDEVMEAAEQHFEE